MVDSVPSSDSLVGSGPPPAQQEDNTSSNIDNNDNNKIKSSPTTNSTTDAETATTEMSTPTKQPYVNSPSPITTNNRTPSPVALAAAKFESQKGIDSPPKPNKSISSTSPTKVEEMPPKKNALFSQWQQKSAKASPIIPGQKGSSVSERPVYTGKRWSPPKKTQQGSGVGSSGVVTPSSPSKNTTPPFKPPRPPASPKASGKYRGLYCCSIVNL